MLSAVFLCHLNHAFVSRQPGKLAEAFKYFVQGMGYSKSPSVAVTSAWFPVAADDVGPLNEGTSGKRPLLVECRMRPIVCEQFSLTGPVVADPVSSVLFAVCGTHNPQ